MDGECLPLPRDDSRRVTAGDLVPIRRAISAWDNPACSRAFSICRSSVYSGIVLLYAASVSGLVKTFSFKSAWFITLYLRHPASGKSDLFGRRLVRLFDKAMQHNDTLPRQCAIKHPSDAFLTLDAKLKQ